MKRYVWILLGTLILGALVGVQTGMAQGGCNQWGGGYSDDSCFDLDWCGYVVYCYQMICNDYPDGTICTSWSLLSCQFFDCAYWAPHCGSC
jgi:hypothetical protein